MACGQPTKRSMSVLSAAAAMHDLATTPPAELLPSLPSLPPHLPIEIAEPILAVAIQRAAIASLWDPASIVQPLNALSRTFAPLPTKVALMHLPLTDLDTATQLNDVDLLRFMLAWSKQPGGRPVNYNYPLFFAMERGHLAVLDWWMDESGLSFPWEADAIPEACSEGHLHVLQWWANRGFPGLDKTAPLMPNALCKASRHGHVHILEWLLLYLPNAQAYCDRALGKRAVLSLAASARQTAVLEQDRTGTTTTMPLLAPIVTAAFQHKQVSVLKWCQDHPKAIKEYQQQQVFDTTNSTLVYAVQGPLFDWIDILGIVPSQHEHWPASEAACMAGNVAALEWMRCKQYLAGSRRQLVAAAMDSGNIDVLEWIHVHVDVATADVGHQKETDPFLNACACGYLKGLDWLLDHGYQMDKSKTEKYLDRACDQEVPVLDWLVLHLSPHPYDLVQVAFESGFDNAVSVSVLDWWSKHVQASGILDRLIVGKIALQYRQFWAPLYYSPTAWDWWLNCSGALRNHILPVANDLCVQVSGLWPDSHPSADAVAILQVWLDSGLELDVCGCIRSASVSSNIVVLEWLLNVVKTPIDVFVSAFSRNRDQQGNLDSWQNYGPKALLWWWANIPQVRNWTGPLSCGPMFIPIDSHMFPAMLKISHFPCKDAVTLSEEGNVPMLQYLHDRDEYRIDMLDGCSLEEVIEAAQDAGHTHVVEWWNTWSSFGNGRRWDKHIGPSG